MDGIDFNKRSAHGAQIRAAGPPHARRRHRGEERALLPKWKLPGGSGRVAAAHQRPLCLSLRSRETGNRCRCPRNSSRETRGVWGHGAQPGHGPQLRQHHAQACGDLHPPRCPILSGNSAGLEANAVGTAQARHPHICLKVHPQSGSGPDPPGVLRGAPILCRVPLGSGLGSGWGRRRNPQRKGELGSWSRSLRAPGMGPRRFTGSTARDSPE